MSKGYVGIGVGIAMVILSFGGLGLAIMLTAIEILQGSMASAFGGPTSEQSPMATICLAAIPSLMAIGAFCTWITARLLHARASNAQDTD